MIAVCDPRSETSGTWGVTPPSPAVGDTCTVPPLSRLLDEVLSAPPLAVDPATVLADARSMLDRASQAATDALEAARLPVRLPRDRIARLLACEQLALATAAPTPLTEPVVRGRVLDRLLHHHVHGDGPAAGPALAIAIGAFEAERDDDVVTWLETDPATRARLAEDATEYAERLAALGAVDDAWWPRCEDRVRVDLADGAVVCAAQLDLVLGGPPTDRPMVVLEAKSGPFAGEHRDGLLWYALLAGLRHGVPPRAVIGWSGWDGRAWWQPVTADGLLGAAARAVDALDRLGGLLAGRPAERAPCRACAWCPERETCEVARPAMTDDG